MKPLKKYSVLALQLPEGEMNSKIHILNTKREPKEIFLASSMQPFSVEMNGGSGSEIMQNEEIR